MEIQINHRALEECRGFPPGYKDAFAHSVQYCVSLAVNGDSFAAGVVAEGLFSAARHDWGFEVHKLVRLDSITSEHLLNVFRLRHYGVKPQHIILNGETVFEHISNNLLNILVTRKTEK